MKSESTFANNQNFDTPVWKICSFFSQPPQSTITRLYCWSLLTILYSDIKTLQQTIVTSTKTTLSWVQDNKKLNKTKLTTKKVSCPFTFPLMFEVYFIFQTNFSSSLYPIARALGLSLLHLTFVKMICTIHCWVYEFHIEITDESFSQGSNEKDESDSHGRLRRAPFCNETPHSLNLFAFSWNCWNEFLVLAQFAKIISLIC